MICSVANASSDSFWTVSGSFHGLLVLRELFNRILIDEVKNTSAGPSSSEIIHKVGIFKGSGRDNVASRSRHIMKKLFLGVTIDTVVVGPFEGDILQIRIVSRNSSVKANGNI